MSVHAYQATARARRVVRLSSLVATALGLGAGAAVLVTRGLRPGFLVLAVGTPIAVGLVAAVATLIVAPFMTRDLQRQFDEEDAQQRALLGNELLITEGVARYFHPVPAQHVPLGSGEVTAYATGYLAFENGGGGYYRSRHLDGWRVTGENEFVLECSPLYLITLTTRHTLEWQAWLSEFHGPGTVHTVIDLAAAEQPYVVPAEPSQATPTEQVYALDGFEHSSDLLQPPSSRADI